MRSWLLKHVLLSLAVGLERRARRLDGGVEVLDCVPTILAHAVTELKSLDLANRADIDAAVIGAALRGTRRGHDLSGIIVLRGIRIRVLNDVFRQAMGSLF